MEALELKVTLEQAGLILESIDEYLKKLATSHPVAQKLASLYDELEIQIDYQETTMTPIVPQHTIAMWERQNIANAQVLETLPKVKLVGTDGNVFAIISTVTRALKEAGQKKEAKEFTERSFKAQSYDEVLALISEYCNIT